MLPSSAGRLLILLDERSRYTRLCSLAMSGGMRDSELSLRCRAVRWVRDHRAVLRLLTRPAGTAGKGHSRGLNPGIQPLPPSHLRKHLQIICCKLVQTCKHGLTNFTMTKWCLSIIFGLDSFKKYIIDKQSHVKAVSLHPPQVQVNFTVTHFKSC